MDDGKFILESPRLRFRLMEERDLENLMALDMDPEVRAHFPEGIASPGAISDRINRNRESFAAKGYCDFVVVHRESGPFVGRAGFGDLAGDEIEVGYVLSKDFWGQGLAQEALRALLAWARESVDAARILAYAPATHAGSLNVMRKSGMLYLRTGRTRGVDCVFYEFPL